MQSLAGSLNYIPIPLESIPIDVRLPFPLYVKVSEKFVKFRAVNDTISTKRVQGLEEKVDIVFVDETSWIAFLTCLESIFDIYISDPERAVRNTHALLVSYAQGLERMRIFDAKTVKKIQKASNRLSDLALAHPEIQPKLLKRYAETALYYSNHSLNVAVYSIAIGIKLGLTRNQIRELCLCCLLHNIGNSTLPNDLLYKPGEYTEEEWKLMQTHPDKGAKLLEAVSMSEEVVMAVRQHHERVDGKGYPKRLKGNEIHLYAKICSIADVYDALITNKPYGNPPCTPTEAIDQMQKMQGKFDPEILFELQEG